MMNRAILLLLSIVTCSPLVKGDPPADGDSDNPVVEEDATLKLVLDPAGKEYFPRGRASYYTDDLAAMKEPSLQPPLGKGVERVLRFTFLPSFDDALVVRITEAGEKVVARAVRLKKDESERPVKVVYDKTWELDEKGKKALAGILPVPKDFWTPLSEFEEALGGLDGEMWIFEIHDKDGYRMVDVWSPEVLATMDKEMVRNYIKKAGGDIAKIRDFLVYETTGEKLLEIGGIRPDPEE